MQCLRRGLCGYPVSIAAAAGTVRSMNSATTSPIHRLHPPREAEFGARQSIKPF